MPRISWASRTLIGLLSAVALWVGVLTSGPASAQTAPSELRVAIFTNYLPVSGIDLAGNPSGLLPDIWQLWSQKTGVPVTFVPRDSFAETVEAVRSGAADVHSGLFWSPDRSDWLDFSRTLFEFSSTLYYWLDRGPAPSVTSLSGKPVGVLAGTYQQEFLSKNPLNFIAHPFDSPVDMLRALARGEVVAIFHEDVAMASLLARQGVAGAVGRVPLDLTRNAARPATRKDRPDIRALVDWGMSMISNQNLAELESRWIGTRPSSYSRISGNKIPYTEAEKNFLTRTDKIRVGLMNEWPPISYTNASGKPSGMSPEFLDRISERFAGKIELVPGKWSDLLQQVRDGKLDAVMDISPTQARMPDFNFTTSYLAVPHVLVTRRSDSAIKSLDDLGGKTIALEKGYATAEFLQANHPDIKVKTFADTADALLGVATGGADAWIGNQAVAEYLLHLYADKMKDLKLGAAVPGRASLSTIGTRRDAPVLRDIFEKGIIGITPQEMKKITDPWLKATISSSIQLSPAEQRWLSEHGDQTIRVLVEDWPPFAYMDGGEAKGIAVAYIRHVLDALDLKYVFVDMGWDDALKSIANLQKIDIVPDIAPSPERRKIVAFTNPYLQFPLVIFMRSDAAIVTGLDDLRGKTIAVERSFIMEERLKKDHPEIKLLSVDNTHQALAAVSLGKADAYVGNLAAGSFHIQRHGISNLKVMSPTKYAEDRQAMGVRQDWPELSSLIDKVIERMTDDQHAALRSSALAIRYEYGLDVKKIMTYAVPALTAVFVIIMIFVFANRKLAREVLERKNAEALLLERETRFKSLLESAPDATVIVDQTGDIVMVNRQAEVLFGADREKLLGKKVETLVPDSVKAKHVGLRSGFVTASAPRDMAVSLKLMARKFDGVEFPVEISLSPIETAEGTLIAASVRDVTLRRAEEAALQEKDIQLTAALENMSSGIIMVDADLKVRVFNRKYVDMLKLPDVHVGMPLRDLLMIRAVRGEFGDGDPVDLAEDRLAKIQSGAFNTSVDFVPDGHIIEGFRQPTADGGVVAIFNDITIRKKTEDALAQQTKALQNLSNKLSRYLSPQIYEAIFAGASDAKVATTRKKLTVFFSDIKNFTATTEEMEPEDMTFLLNDYLTKMTEIVLEHGGTIDKYIGDAIMVFFGDPETKGTREDALAAVRMAIAMQRRMVDLRAKWADMGFRLPFHIRCGINTGYCNVGNFGSEQRIDYTIIGGQVNLAARLEGICEPDGVTISYETYSLVRDEVDADPLEPIQVKGIREAVKPYAIKGIVDDWNENERYIRRDIRGMRLWVDLMRMSEDQRVQSIRELEEALDILKQKRIDAAD